MTSPFSPLVQGFRLLRRSPGMAWTVVVTLGLGIAASTALFTVVQAVVLAPLPFADSSRLVQIWRSELPALTYGSASYGRHLDWRAGQRAFTDVGVWAPRGVTLVAGDGAERVNGALISASFFQVLGVTPVAGRLLTGDDDRRGAARVALLSEGLWRRRFGASPAAIGRGVQIDGEPYTIIGVVPASVAEVWRFEAWIPVAPSADPLNRGSNYLSTVARLRPGMTLGAARSAMADLAVQLSREHADDRYTFTVRPLHEVVTEGATRGLWVLLGATVLLLVIACTNVANLLLARAVTRERDLAIRASLGAGRAQMVGLVVGETVALGLIGSVLGAALASALLGTFVRLAPPNFPRLAAIGLDLGVLAMAIVIAVAAAVAAALVPALHVVRGDVNATVRAGASRGATAGRARALGRVLVAAEIALALALITTAGVLVKSLLRLQATDLGMTRAPVLTFSVGLPPFVADGDAAVLRFHDEFVRRVRALPGITHASAINMLPIANTGNNGPVRRTDQTGERDGVPVTEVRVVMDGYAETMGLRMLAGRAIDDRDGPQSAPVAVVNQTLASRLWPALAPADVVGQRLRVEYFGDAPPREVVGVVADVRSRRPDAPSDPEVHAPFRQVPFAGLSYVVRSEGDPTALTGAIRQELASMTPHVAIGAVRTFDDVVETATRTSGLLSWLSVLFGGLALALAAVGIYGLLSYSVAQRERELAVRAAVGASRRALMGLVLGEGARLTVIGLAAGLAMAWAASSVVAGLLYEVSATDGAVFLAAPVALALVAFLGYAVPAIRASRVEPVASLRAE